LNNSLRDFDRDFDLFTDASLLFALIVSTDFLFFRTDSGTGTGAPAALVSFDPFLEAGLGDVVSFGEATSFF